MLEFWLKSCLCGENDPCVSYQKCCSNILNQDIIRSKAMKTKLFYLYQDDWSFQAWKCETCFALETVEIVSHFAPFQSEKKMLRFMDFYIFTSSRTALRFSLSVKWMFNVVSLPQSHTFLNVGLNKKNKAVEVIKSYVVRKRPMKGFVIMLHNHNIWYYYVFFSLCCYIYLGALLFRSSHGSR